MLTKAEIKEKNTIFWSDFKAYMSKIKSTNGKKISWLAYPTEIKFIYLRLSVNKQEVSMNFDIQHKDSAIRSVFWEQMGELKKVFNEHIGEDSIWMEHCSNETLSDFCRIQYKTNEFNYLKEENWPSIFEFLKSKLIGFDAFYQEYKDLLLFLAH